MDTAITAIRSLQDVIAGAVTVKLPTHFTGKRVEVIILPVEEGSTEAQLPRLLLTAPTLSEDDLKGYLQVRDWMVQWNVNEF